jgi:hypothetical protein
MEAKENTINIKGDGFFNIKHLMVSKTWLANVRDRPYLGELPKFDWFMINSLVLKFPV